MNVVPLRPHIGAPALEFPVGEDDAGELPMMKCERCRLSFVRHPSISDDDSKAWKLCSPCRGVVRGRGNATRPRWLEAVATTP
jgi:hypothetical protein